MTDLDVLALDRTLRRANETWRRWRRGLVQGEGIEEDPFLFTRPALGQTKLAAVRELGADDPLRVRFERWIVRLAEQRINRQVLARCVYHRRLERHPVETPARGEWSVSEMLQHALRATPTRRSWLAALMARGGDLVAVEVALWERRRELATRFGFTGQDAMEPITPVVESAIDGFWQATDDLAESFAVPDLPSFLGLALADGARDGWPGRMSPTALAGLLKGTPWIDRVSLDLPPLPAAVAPATFARGIAMVGAAFARALAPQHQPFVVATDPHGLPEHIQGALVGLILLSPPFVRRQLEIGPARLGASMRALAGMTVCHARGLALALTLRASALEGRQAFAAALEDQAARVLGFPLPRIGTGVFFRPRADSASRLAGLLLAAHRFVELVEQYDEDWYFNPRAADAVRADANSIPGVPPTAGELVEGAASLRRLVAGRL
ncbi:MAG: hypothetical protein JW751_32470 [Polyangiaceae bacterium]|nr:hypothetical protein [Polyangiaceae bacterium]